MNRLRRVASAPVHQLTDPALAARLLGVGTDALMAGTERWEGDGTLLGALFESLMTLSVRVYAQACEARVHHLRTQGGEREVDLIVERADGAIVALEVKLKSVITDRDVRHLQWLRDQIGSRMLDAAVLSTGRQAYRRADGIGVIPAALLGPDPNAGHLVATWEAVWGNSYPRVFVALTWAFVKSTDVTPSALVMLGPGRPLRLGSRVGDAVAHAGHGEDVGGLSGAVAELAAQSLDGAAQHPRLR